jgi:hypothetical protein
MCIVHRLQVVALGFWKSSIGRFDPRPEVTDKSGFAVCDSLLVMQSFLGVAGSDEVEEVGPERLAGDELSIENEFSAITIQPGR